MKRRSFFATFAAFSAGVLLPPIRAAKARLRQLRPLQWHGLSPRWKRLEKPELVTYCGEEAQVVTTLCRPTHFRTRMDTDAYLAAMRDAGCHRPGCEQRGPVGHILGTNKAGKVELYYQSMLANDDGSDRHRSAASRASRRRPRGPKWDIVRRGT